MKNESWSSAALTCDSWLKMAAKINSGNRVGRFQVPRIGLAWWRRTAALISPYTSEFKIHNSRFTLYLLSFALFISAFCLLPGELHAQGCAMCYTSASAARSAAKQALANGTLILLVPPMVFFALITVVLFVYRNKYRDESVVRNSESEMGSPLSAEQRFPQEISQEENFGIAAELRYLEADSGLAAPDAGLPTPDDGLRDTDGEQWTTDKQYQRS